MERNELLQVYAFCSSIWQNFRLPQNEFDMKIFNESWYVFLKPYPKSLVFSVITDYATKNAFCNIAQIADQCRKLVEMKNGTYIDAEKVLDEIRNAISYDRCAENFEKLSPFAKEIVGHKAYLAQWARSEQFETVIVSNLRKKINNMLETKHFENTMKIVGQLAGKEYDKLQQPK